MLPHFKIFNLKRQVKVKSYAHSLYAISSSLDSRQYNETHSTSHREMNKYIYDILK